MTVLSLDSLGLDTARGVRLDQAAYKTDFRRRWSTIDGQDSWKLERRQHFREPGKPSWEAFVRGDWRESLRLIEERRDAVRATEEDDQRRGIVFRRVRVVEKPLTPYMQWELNSFRLRVEAGERIRVVGPEALGALEENGQLPELISVGDETLYEIRYDGRGVPDGAVRYTDRWLVDRHRRMCRDLFEEGEELPAFFRRDVAHLPPPPAQD